MKLKTALNEIWIPVYECPRYQVSNLGRVKNALSGRLLKPNNHTAGGYLTVRLYPRKGKPLDRLVHRLVLVAFVGKRLEDREAHHINHIRTDNRAVNLMWVTRQDNINFSKGRAKNILKGQAHPWAVLTESDVRDIRARAKYGVTQSTLAVEYGLTQAGISAIVRRKNWKHLE